MKKFTKIAAALLSAAVTLSAVGAAAYESAINIKLDGIVDNGSHYISFSGVRPAQINGSTFVPIRQLAEAAGMTVIWDQVNQTALINLSANENSSKPVEKYAAAVISRVSGYGLELTPDNISVELRLNDANAVIRYNFKDTTGENVAIGKNITLDSPAAMIDNSLMIPLRNSMEAFDLNVSWDQPTLTAGISIPDYVSAPKGLAIVANYAPGTDYTPAAAPQVTQTTVTADAPVDTNPALGTYIGRFMITHYCSCPECNEGWGNHTAWAGEIIPGQTIAVDPNVIGKLRWVYIDGYGIRRAEDCGGAVKGYHIDMAVPDHRAAESIGVVYKDVYYLAE